MEQEDEYNKININKRKIKYELDEINKVKLYNQKIVKIYWAVYIVFVLYNVLYLGNNMKFQGIVAIVMFILPLIFVYNLIPFPTTWGV